MPVPFTAAQIKAWFETADVPTQQQFADFVDTMFHMVQQANDNADAATAAAAAAEALVEARMPKVFGLLTSASSWAVGNQYGCVITRTGTWNHIITVTFAVAYADTNYTILMGGKQLDVLTLTSKTTGSFVVAFPNAAAPAGSTFDFAILR